MNDNNLGWQRDLIKYAREYDSLAFEDIQETFRRVEILKSLETFSWRSIIEVGCGNISILTKLKEFEKAAINNTLHCLTKSGTSAY